MNEITISNIALTLCCVPAVVHAVELIKPTWVKYLINWVLSLFAPGLPDKKQFITEKDQLNMLDAAIAAAPDDKKTSAKDYIFILLFEQRQNALAFIAVMVGAIAGMNLPLEGRNTLHLMFLVMSVIFTLVNANHAGFMPFFGKHPRVSRNGKHVGIVFSVFWTVSSVLNFLAFTYASN